MGYRKFNNFVCGKPVEGFTMMLGSISVWDSKCLYPDSESNAFTMASTGVPIQEYSLPLGA